MKGIDENTDLFAAAVEADKRKEPIIAAEALQERLNNNARERAKNKTLKRAAIKKKLKEARRRDIVTFTAGALAGVLATVGITGLYGKIEKNQKVKSAAKTLEKQAEVVLLEQGLAERNEDGDVVVRDNDISDYRCLDLTHASSLEQHIYSEVLGSEFNDAIQTASYENGGYYFTGTNQWRNYNGYIDKETGNPSYIEQRAAMEEKLLEAYKNNCEGIIRPSEELHDGIIMGGR